MYWFFFFGGVGFVKLRQKDTVSNTTFMTLDAEPHLLDFYWVVKSITEKDLAPII